MDEEAPREMEEIGYRAGRCCTGLVWEGRVDGPGRGGAGYCSRGHLHTGRRVEAGKDINNSDLQVMELLCVLLCCSGGGGEGQRGSVACGTCGYALFNLDVVFSSLCLVSRAKLSDITLSSRRPR